MPIRIAHEQKIKLVSCLAKQQYGVYYRHIKILDSLKIAKVIPIHKKDDSSLVSNYRPVSILPSIYKVLERLTYNRLYDFLTKNELLYENQYGFGKFHSTELALLHLFERVSNALADHKHVIGVFMDLSKAFDTLEYTILIR